MSVAGLLAGRGAVVFDLDGTLVDTLPDLVDALNAALEELGAAPVPAEVVRRSLHGGLEGSAAEAARHAGLDEARGAELASAYARRYALAPARRSRAYEGVDELLSRLRGRGVRLAVCTNKRAAQAEQVLAATGLLDWFDAVVGADTCARRKPDPEPVLHALAGAAAGRDEAVLIGDSLVDVQSAVAARLPCVLHAGGYGEVPAGERGVIGRFSRWRDLLEA